MPVTPGSAAKLVDHDSNFIQQEIRNTAMGVFGLQDNLYASGMLPQQSEQRSDATYWFYDKKYFLSSQVQARLPGTVNPVANYAVGTKTMHIDEKGLRVAVTDEEIANSSDVLSPLADAAMFLAHNFIVEFELDFAKELIKDDVWTFQAQGQAGAATGPDAPFTKDPTALSGAGMAKFQQFDAASSDPYEVMIACMRRMHKETGLRPNKMLIPRIVLDKVRDNATTKEWVANTIGINGGEEQTINVIALQTGLNVADIHIVDLPIQTVNSVTKADRDVQNHNFGQALTPVFGEMEYAIEKDILFMYTGQFMGKFTKTAACVFRWDGLISTVSGNTGSAPLGQGADYGNVIVRSYYDDRNYTHYVDGLFAYKIEITAPDLGFLLKDCIA